MKRKILAHKKNSCTQFTYSLVHLLYVTLTDTHKQTNGFYNCIQSISFSSFSIFHLMFVHTFENNSFISLRYQQTNKTTTKVSSKASSWGNVSRFRVENAKLHFHFNSHEKKNNYTQWVYSWWLATAQEVDKLQSINATWMCNKSNAVRLKFAIYFYLLFTVLIWFPSQFPFTTTPIFSVVYFWQVHRFYCNSVHYTRSHQPHHNHVMCTQWSIDGIS